jgi:hypothetical protein
VGGSLGDEERTPTPNPSPQREDALGEGSAPHVPRRQRRICFIWTEEGPANVEIVDYH